jgi:phosphohistidine phosphatase SixA
VALVIDLLRHGAAESSGPAGDASRPLSAPGVTKIRALAARLARDGWAPGRAFASPLLRAQETARLMIAPLTEPPELVTLAELEPDGDPEDLLRVLSAMGATSGQVLLVSHMPLVSRLSAHLCGRQAGFRTADLARIECPSGLARGACRWGGFPVHKDSA